MNIFRKLALRSLKNNRTGTLITAIGVMLSALLITAVASFGISLYSYMLNGSIMTYGSWHVHFHDADSDFVRQQQESSEVENVTLMRDVGYAGIDSGFPDAKPYIFIASLDSEGFEKLPLNIFTGRLPEREGETVVSGKLSTQAGVELRLGEEITLNVGRREFEGKTLWQHEYYESESLVNTEKKTYKIVGICNTPIFEPNSAPGYTLVTYGDAADAWETGSVFVTLKEAQNASSYAVNNSGSYLLNTKVLRFMGASDNSAFNSFMISVGSLAMLITMFGSVCLIYNAFNITLGERIRQMGMLMSIGATKKQIRSSVLFEGFCIGCIGIPLGIVLGILGIKIVLAAVSDSFSGILFSGVELEVVISAPIILLAAFVSMITVLISAYIPAKKAAARPVMECIRQSGELEVDAKSVKTAPFVLRYLGMEGALAMKSFKRNAKRCRSVVMSLTLSVILFIASNALVTDMKMSVATNEVSTYNISLTLSDVIADAELEKLHRLIKTTEGVSDSTAMAVAKSTAVLDPAILAAEAKENLEYITDGNTDVLNIQFEFLDDASYSRLLEEFGLDEEEFSGKDRRFPAMGLYKMNGGLNKLFADREQSISVKPMGSDTSAEINAVFVDQILPDPVLSLTQTNTVRYTILIAAPCSQRAELGFEDSSIVVKGISIKSDSSIETQKRIETALMESGFTYSYQIFNLDDIMRETRNIVFIIDVFTKTFIAIISLIAAANVFNTISTNIRLRRREFAMLRSVGMEESAFNRMMRFESVFYGMRTLLLGLPLSVLAVWFIWFVGFTNDELYVSFVYPFGSAALSASGVVIIIMLSMFYSVNKLRKENIIDTLRDDMI